jgi:hypothetical protein
MRWRSLRRRSSNSIGFLSRVLRLYKDRHMHRIGILSFSSPGHFYPLTALGRRLQSRGHEVVYFQVADLERPIRAAGLQFRQLGREDFPPGLDPRAG